MKLLLVENYLADQQESMLRFGAMLKSGLRERGVSVRSWSPKVVFGGNGSLSSAAKWLGYIDKFVLSRASLKHAAKWADVVHITDHSNAVYGPLAGGRPVLVTCHDLLAIRNALGELPEQKVKLTGKLLQRWILSSIAKASRVVCVSATTQNDLSRLAPSLNGRTEVVWNGLNHPYERKDLSAMKSTVKAAFVKRQIKQPSKFIFHIGGNQWYKNRTFVIQVFGKLLELTRNRDLSLVMAGKDPMPEMRALVDQCGLKEQVIWLGPVENKELEALYHAAEFLLFPSLAEGFGWPIAEALACGCAVVTTDRAPMNEVGGPVSLYLDPSDLIDSARRLANTIQSSELKTPEAVALRLSWADRFQASTMLDSYQRVYALLQAAGRKPLRSASIGRWD